MTALTDYSENPTADQYLGSGTPATVYVGLTTVTVTDSMTGSTITEPVGNNYSRVAVTNNATNWPAASGGLKTNGIQIDFPTPSGSWGECLDVVILDAASGGNILYHIPLTTPQTPESGNAVYFPIGALDLQFA